jgi:hypothetical protein
MDFSKIFLMILLILFSGVAGCATTSPIAKNDSAFNQQHRAESRAEELSAIESVVGAISGQKLTDEERRKMLHNLRKDEEAQSAVLAIKDGVTSEKAVVKYCPRDGKRYHARFTMCPEHNVPLETVSD